MGMDKSWLLVAYYSGDIGIRTFQFYRFEAALQSMNDYPHRPSAIFEVENGYVAVIPTMTQKGEQR